MKKLERDEKCDLSFYGIGRVGSSNYVTNTETSNECKHVYYNMYVNAFCEKITLSQEDTIEEDTIAVSPLADLTCYDAEICVKCNSKRNKGNPCVENYTLPFGSEIVCIIFYCDMRKTNACNHGLSCT